MPSGPLANSARALLFALIACCACVGMLRAQAKTIDILVVYTDELEARHLDVDGVEALLASSFFSANEGFSESGVDLEVRLAGFRKVDYAESSYSMQQNLDHLTDSDGIMDEVLEWRDDYGADLVYFFRGHEGSSNTIGIAWILGNAQGVPSKGFGVVAANHALSGLVLQHEVGHNLGAAHDRENASSSGLFFDSYGHRFGRGGDFPVTYRTVMAYDPGTLINRFSNPDKNFDFLATGVLEGDEAANNARTLNQTASAVAAYRSFAGEIPPAANAGPDRWLEAEQGESAATVALDGSGSWVGTESATWKWTWQGGSATGKQAFVELPVGAHVVELTVTDSFGNDGVDSVRVVVEPYAPVASIVNSGSAVFVVKENGIVRASGSNMSGQLGIGTLDTPTEPEFVLLGDVASVVEGSSSETTLFVTKSGALFGAGLLGYADVQTYDSTRYRTPKLLVASGVESAAKGDGFILYVSGDGALWGWGENTASALGQGERSAWLPRTKLIESGVASVAAGPNFSLILMTDGSLWGAGAIYRDLFGENPGEIPTGRFEIFDSGVEKVVAGSTHAAALMSNGAVWTFGDAFESKALGSRQTDHKPYNLVPEGAIDLWASDMATLVKMEDGSIWGTGEALYPLEGLIHDPIRPQPLTRLFGSRVESVAVGGWTWVLLRNDQSIWGIGANYGNPLGIDPSNEVLDTWTSLPWAVAPSLVGNSPPTIVVDGALTAYDTDGDGMARVLLKAGRSDDDWWIASYEWEVGGETIEGPTLDGQYPVGELVVTLTVTDDDGAASERVLNLQVLIPAAVVDLDVGSQNIVALRADGSVWGIGPNPAGGLGEAEGGRSKEEWKQIVASGMTSISVGNGHLLGLMADGSLWVTGFNQNGQLGDGTQTNSFGFKKIVESGVVAVEAGAHHSLFIMEDGSAWGMGSNQENRLGLGNEDRALSPVKLVASGVRSLAAGDRSSMLVMEDGSLLGTGREAGGSVESPSFVTIVDEGVLEAFGSIGSRGYFMTQDGELFRLELPSRADYEVVLHPIAVKGRHELANAGIAQFVAGVESVFVRTEAGSLLGLDTQALRGPDFESPPGEIDPLFGSGVLDVASGVRYSAFLLADGSVWGMGNRADEYVEWNDGLFAGLEQGLPIELVASTSQVANAAPKAAAGPDQSVFALADAESAEVYLSSSASYDDRFITEWKWTWGDSEAIGRSIQPRLPLGTTEFTLTVRDDAGEVASDTVAVEVRADFEVASIAGSSMWSLIILTDGSVYGSTQNWGAAFGPGGGQVRYGVKLPVEGIVDASVSQTHALLVGGDGSLWFFGDNREGQAGLGRYRSLEEPIRVMDGGVRAVSAGNGFSLALMEDGSLRACGGNYFGQLGVGDEESRAFFTQVVSAGVRSVAAGPGFSVFVKDDGSVWQMGDSPLDGSETKNLLPTRVLDGGAKSVAAEDNLVYAVAETGALYGARARAEDDPRSGQAGWERWTLLLDSGVVQVRQGYAIRDDGSLWSVRPSESYWDRDVEFYPPNKLIAEGVKDFASADGGAMALREDGLVFSSGEGFRFHFGTPPAWDASWNRLAGKSTGWTSEPPVARLRGGAYFLDADGWLVLDGSLTSDDWIIDHWTWRIGDQDHSGRSYAQLQLEEGPYDVELEVIDSEGNVSKVRVQISVSDLEQHLVWLANYFSEGEIAAMDDPLGDDSDGDGQSNATERRLGTAPNDASDRAWLGWSFADGELFLQAFRVQAGARFTVSTSSDLETWSVDPRILEADADGEAILKMDTDGAVFIRLE